ncbi:prepilin peptidase [Nocardioides marmoraquaticus]
MLDSVLPALVAALIGGVLAVPAPRWLARVPEPVPAPAGEVSGPLGPPPAKEPYADIAALPWFAPVVAVASAIVSGVFGAALGWTGALVLLVPLVPVGVVLLVVDARTTLLPTRVIHPTYAALAVLLPLAALVDRDLDALVRAALGWLVVGGWFWVFWWLLGAWGFGDVRLARVLGPVLGYLGWSEVVVGLLLMVLLGGVAGVVLTARDRDLRRRFPFGPAMLVGAALAVPLAAPLARAAGYPVS